MNTPETILVVDDPKELPYPGFAREKAALELKLAEMERASSTILPGPLREVFAGELPKLHGFTLQPVTMGLHPILVQIKSPLLEVVRILKEEMARADDLDTSTTELKTAALKARQQRAGERAQKELPNDPAASVETVFCFVTPASELRRLLAIGRPALTERAMEVVGDKLHPSEFAELQQLCSAHYVASFSTALRHKAREREGDGSFR